jgi:hypothetical protein
MGTCAAVRGLVRMPVAGPAFRRAEAGENASDRCGRDAGIEGIRNLLSQAGHTIAQLSEVTGKLYGSKSPYFIPPTFLYKLKSGITPQICQMAALSEITGYRFIDWMKICGFDLHAIPRLQMRLHTERTVLVTPVEFEPASFVSSLVSSDEAVCGSSMTSRQEKVRRSDRGRYMFAKIGSGDAVLCPKLTPGSVVRVDRCYAHWIRGADCTSMRSLLWLVEQPSGLTCSYVRWMDHQRVVLLPSRPPWGSWPLRLPAEARILGLVDMEVLPAQPVELKLRTQPVKLEQPFPQACGKKRMAFSDLLRVSRCRTGLTFRAAHRLTCAVADILGSRDYAIALGLLSDYEAMGRLPRHIAKIISLCVTYCIDIRELMEAAGVNIDDSAKMRIPMRDHPLHVHLDFRDSAQPYSTIGIGVRSAQSAAPQLERTSLI